MNSKCLRNFAEKTVLSLSPLVYSCMLCERLDTAAPSRSLGNQS